MIKLLAPEDGDLSDFTPAHYTAKDGVSGLWYGNNPAPTRQEITLPKGITCKNCVIRVLKYGMAPDPTDPASQYYFNSCADVNVVHDSESSASNTLPVK